jgi:carboxyl-terminal processing protease
LRGHNHSTREICRLSTVKQPAQLLRLVVALALSSTLALSQTLPVSPAESLFNRALSTLQMNYYGYAKLDAAALRTSYLPRLELSCAARADCPFDAATDLVSEMVSSLKDPHTYRLPADQSVTVNRDFNNLVSKDASFGMMLASVPGAGVLVVKHVLEDGPAYRAGLRRGDTIVALNDQVLDRFGSARAAFDVIGRSEREAEPLRLQARRAGRAARTLELSPVPLQPWPPQLELRPDGIAVISLSQFKANGGVANRVHALVAQAVALKARALILDVRDSSGGLISEMLGAAGAFIERPALLDEFKDGRYLYEFKDGRFAQTDSQGRRAEFNVVSQASRWTGPLVVLTNGIAKSAPEYLAYLLQHANRAKVIGEPTLGALNTSNSFFGLPDGSALAVSLGRSLDLSGAPFPERVTPDVSVRDDLAALAVGRDLALETAVRVLDNRNLNRLEPKSHQRDEIPREARF